ncbi:hypothetical protein [Sodalis praecaptivus]|uniref:hypothetical protein n=1 Tax=Sodalis TaxID=84565 RepID=UPI0011DCE900|nr:hypothetical protein [Sodalis praecaptivus]
MPSELARLERSIQTALLDFAVEEIQSSGSLTTKALASVLMAIRQTHLTFSDGSTATMVYHHRSIVYRDAKNNMLAIECFYPEE